VLGSLFVGAQRSIFTGAVALAIGLPCGGPAAAQYVFAPVPASGPHQSTDWQGGFNLGTAASGTYTSYFIATDWATTAGDQWSTEARAALHGGPLGASPGSAFFGPVDSGTNYAATYGPPAGSRSDPTPRTNMHWRGSLDTPFMSDGSTPLYLSTRQTWSNADPLLDMATWSNIRVVLDPVINETTLTTGAPVPTVATNLGTLAVGSTGLSLSVSNTATGAAGISWYRFTVDSPVDSTNAFDFYTTVGGEPVRSVLSLFADSATGLLPVASDSGMDYFSGSDSGLTFGSTDASQFQRLSYQVPNPGFFDGRGGTIALDGFGPSDGYYDDVPGAALLSPGTDYYLAVGRPDAGFIDATVTGSVAIGAGGTVSITNERFVGVTTGTLPLGTGNVTLRIESQQVLPTLVWRASGSSPGGSGTWSPTGLTWSDGSTTAAWDPAIRAVFSGSGGTVTVGPGVAANAGLQIASDGYTLTGGTLTLGGTSAAQNFIYVNDGVNSARIDAPLAGSAGLTKLGPGDLVLGGSSSYTGGTLVRQGRLTIGAGGTSGSIGGDIDIGPATGVQIDRSDLAVFTGDIGGSGYLDVVGTGTTVFVGDVTPASLAVGNSSTAVIGAGGTTGNLTTSAFVAQDARLVFNRADEVEFVGGLSGAGTLVQFGSGTTTLLLASPSFSGAAVVSHGTLKLATPDALGPYPKVDVAAGATFDVSAIPAGFQFGSEGEGVLSGNGSVEGSVSIGGFGGTLSPGASPGTLAVTGNVTLGPNGNYNWQLFNATGTAGSTAGWDLLTVGGVLDVTSEAIAPFHINLWSLSGVGPDVSGDAINWNATTSGTWRIATAAGGISHFSADNFLINVLPTNGTAGFTNDLAGGTFSLAQSGNDLNLVFTAGGSPTVITINVASGTQTQTAAGHPLLSGGTPVQKTGPGTLVLDQANTLTGATTVSQGTLELATADALSDSILLVDTGGTLTVGPQVTAVVSGVSINGLVDVGLGGLTIMAGQTAQDLVADIVAGRNDGTWDGATGITSSAAAAQNERAVGWLDNGDGSFTVGFAAAGDLDMNGLVDLDDVIAFVGGGLYDTGLAATWANGDYDYNGIVDLDDVIAFVSGGLYDAGPYNAAEGGMSLMAFGGDDPGLMNGGFAAVPEPSTWMLLMLGATSLVARRRTNAACAWRLLLNR